MEIVSVLRVLARHRVAVVLGIIVSVLAAGLAVKQAMRTQTSTVAWGSMLLAQPATTSSAKDSKITDTLPSRATLLADLMMTDSAEAQIAQLSHLQRSDVAVRAPVVGPPEVQVPMPVAAQASGLPAATYVVALTTQDPTTGSGVPIIGITVAGPDLATARRIVTAATTTMQRVVGGSEQATSLVAEPLGAPQGKITTTSGKKVIAAVALLMVFVVWMSGIVVIDGLRRRRRERRRYRALQGTTA
jgi:hypothetical protein